MSCPSSFLPTRLADGLEAKKSSPVVQIRPCKSIGSPALFFNNFGNLNLGKFNGKELGKARILSVDVEDKIRKMQERYVLA